MGTRSGGPAGDDRDDAPRLYGDLAAWWPLISPPEDYAEEAAFFRRALIQAGDTPPRTVLELGSGGGSNASHLKRDFDLTLVDRAPGMLAVSRALNPECTHFEGDMRAVRLGRTYDAVFVHDAILYMTTRADLRLALETAFVHCRPGGVALFVPDHVRETFAPATEHGGVDRGGRGARYLEWSFDPDPGDTTFEAHFVYLLRDAGGPVRVEHDRHVMGLFPRATWTRLLRRVGFRPEVLRDDYDRDVFVAVRPA
jgi:SAM-dependent methyltransferase